MAKRIKHTRKDKAHFTRTAERCRKANINPNVINRGGTHL